MLTHSTHEGNTMREQWIARVNGQEIARPVCTAAEMSALQRAMPGSDWALAAHEAGRLVVGGVLQAEHWACSVRPAE